MVLTTKVRKKTSRNTKVKKTPYEIEHEARKKQLRDRTLRVHFALSKAAESIGRNQYEVQRAMHLKRGRSPKTFRYAVTSAHEKVIKALTDHGNGKITDAEAMAVLHEYEVFHERLPSAPERAKPGGTRLAERRRGLR